MEKYNLELNGRYLQIHDVNPNSNQTILGIHGLSGNAKQLDYYVDAFGKDYRFITMDLYGRANSRAEGRESKLTEHAKDVKALIAHLDLEDVLLMGYSMGAYISALVARETPEVKAVILLDGAAEMSDHQRPIIEPGLDRLSKKYPTKELYISEVAKGYQVFGIETTDRLKSYLTYEIEEKGDYWGNKASESIVRSDWESFWDFHPQKVGRQIKQPVLLVQAAGEIGDHPPLFFPKHFKETIQAIEKIEVVVSEANHYTMGFEDRPDINQFIQGFLNQL